MFFYLQRWQWRNVQSSALAFTLAFALLAPCAAKVQITEPKAAPSLATLYQQAWQRHPAYAAQAARQAQYASSAELAQSMLAGAPSASVGLRSDGVSDPATRTGLREWELGVSAPLAVGARRRFASDAATLQAKAYAADVQKMQWEMAGEVRDAYWAWQLSHIEHQLAEDEARRAQVVANDSKRRTLAGDTPRVDTLQAQSAVSAAQIHLAETLQKEAQALSALQRLTGSRSLADVPETALAQYQLEIPKEQRLPEHPWLASLQTQSSLSKSKLEAALRVRGEAPTLSAGLSRETTQTTGAFTTARISLGFSFGSDKRYAPQIAEANAHAIEAEITLARHTEQLTQDIALAQAAIDRARDKKNAAQARATTSTEAAQLFGKAFALGELDMPTRLRAEADRAAAVLAMNRAVIEHAAAISKLNQLLGYLP